MINLAVPSLSAPFSSSLLEWDSQCNYKASGTCPHPRVGISWGEREARYVCGCSTAQQSLEQDVQHLPLPHTPITSSTWDTPRPYTHLQMISLTVQTPLRQEKKQLKGHVGMCAEWQGERVWVSVVHCLFEPNRRWKQTKRTFSSHIVSFTCGTPCRRTLWVLQVCMG